MPTKKVQLQADDVWQTIGHLCFLAAALNKPSEADASSVKEMTNLLKDICDRVDRYVEKQSKSYLRFVAFAKVVPVVANIYRDLQRDVVDDDALRTRLLAEVRTVVQKYLGPDTRADKTHFTESKIIKHLMTDALTIREERGPSTAAMVNVGKMFGITVRTSEAVRAKAKTVQVREDDDMAWGVEPYLMLDEVLRSVFGATDDQVFQVLKVFGMREKS